MALVTTCWVAPQPPPKHTPLTRDGRSGGAAAKTSTAIDKPRTGPCGSLPRRILCKFLISLSRTGTQPPSAVGRLLWPWLRGSNALSSVRLMIWAGNLCSFLALAVATGTSCISNLSMAMPSENSAGSHAHGFRGSLTSSQLAV